MSTTVLAKMPAKSEETYKKSIDEIKDLTTSKYPKCPNLIVILEKGHSDPSSSNDIKVNITVTHNLRSKSSFFSTLLDFHQKEKHQNGNTNQEDDIIPEEVKIPTNIVSLRDFSIFIKFIETRKLSDVEPEDAMDLLMCAHFLGCDELVTRVSGIVNRCIRDTDVIVTWKIAKNQHLLQVQEFIRNMIIADLRHKWSKFYGKCDLVFDIQGLEIPANKLILQRRAPEILKTARGIKGEGKSGRLEMCFEGFSFDNCDQIFFDVLSWIHEHQMNKDERRTDFPDEFEQMMNVFQIDLNKPKL